MDYNKTYWNGHPTPCKRIIVKVGSLPVDVFPRAWWRGLEGTERAAVVVEYRKLGMVYLLDDEDGSGWAKVTEGRGSPRVGHKSLPHTSEPVRSTKEATTNAE